MRSAPLRGPVQMASPETIARVMDEGGWDELHCVYPRAGGGALFSSPAYVAEDALLYLEEACGWGCGSGWYLRFTRDGNRWKIVERIDLWITTPLKNSSSTSRPSAFRGKSTTHTSAST